MAKSKFNHKFKAGDVVRVKDSMRAKWSKTYAHPDRITIKRRINEINSQNEPLYQIKEDKFPSSRYSEAWFELKPLPFSPYGAIEKHNGKSSTSGINWSYAKFPKQRDMALFIADCNNNGYRTRNASETPDTEDAAFPWSVQYHHYED